MFLWFTGKTLAKKVEARPSNGLEPATQAKGRMPISNRLRPKEILERDRYAIGWSDIYDHSTNPVKALMLMLLDPTFNSYQYQRVVSQKFILWLLLESERKT